MTMGKKRLTKRSKGTPVSTMPRNTVSLVLDGTEEEYLHNYMSCMSYFRYWMLCNAAVRVRFANRLVYTTPLDGTFYFVLRSQGRYIVFPIVARMVWLVGFYTVNGVFQMDFEGQRGMYLDTDRCVSTGFKAGHEAITGRTGNTRLDLHRVRECFDTIIEYRGPTYPEHPGFRLALGTMVLHLMEPKARAIFTQNCRSIIDPSFNRLGLGFVELLITHWSSLSTEGMIGIDNPDYVITNHGILEITCLGQILDGIFFLHIDAYNAGIFIHDALPPAPRVTTWCPIDPGMGDGDIPLPVEKAVSRLPSHRCCGVSLRGAKDDGAKRRGLTGGGAGGRPVVPEWFTQWEQTDDEVQCNIVEQHLLKHGLLIQQQPCSAPAPSTSSEYTPSAPMQIEKHVLCHGSAKLYNADLDSLEDESLLLDGIIEFVFARMTSFFASEDVLLVSPARTLVLGNLEDPAEIAIQAESLLLNTRRMILFAVNNTDDLDMVDSGNHWSLLVVHIAEDRSSCQFVHHDSLGHTNLDSAGRLADALRPLLPPAPPLISGNTPQQENWYDCGLYLLAISRVIYIWWAERGWCGVSNCWYQDVMTKVDAFRVKAFRAVLRNKLHNELPNHPLDCSN